MAGDFFHDMPTCEASALDIIIHPVHQNVESLKAGLSEVQKDFGSVSAEKGKDKAVEDVGLKSTVLFSTGQGGICVRSHRIGRRKVNSATGRYRKIGGKKTKNITQAKMNLASNLVDV